MLQINLNKLFSKENLVVAIMVAILCVGLFLIYQTTNHLPSQIEKNRKAIEGTNERLDGLQREIDMRLDDLQKEISEIKGMLKILVEEKK